MTLEMQALFQLEQWGIQVKINKNKALFLFLLGRAAVRIHCDWGDDSNEWKKAQNAKMVFVKNILKS